MLEIGPLTAYALDWANLLLRWLHVITAIAWVGSSFYFVWLDNHLEKPLDPALLAKGVGGELWVVHGGGFYNPQKYAGAPAQLPKNLHWFYWESYATWLSGFALFTLMYLVNAGTFLIDKTRFDWSPMAAAHAALAFLLGFWLIYDGLCRTVGRDPRRDGWLGVLVAVVVMAGAWLACQLFAGRAAFLLVGAMIATAMSANVFFRIIPGQRKVIAAMQAGVAVDPKHGMRGKQRSVHNTYFTLPALLAMLINHYGWLYNHVQNWVALVLLMLAGALIRHFFVARHRNDMNGQARPWHWAAAGMAVLLALALWLAPPMSSKMGVPPEAVAGSGQLDAVGEVQAEGAVLISELQSIMAARCVMCHHAALANKGVRLDSLEAIEAQAQSIYQQSVALKLMPLNNVTQMTEEERTLIGKWFAQR